MEYLQTSLNQTSTIKSITMFNRIATSWVKAAINALECRICFPPSSQPEILPEDKESIANLSISPLNMKNKKIRKLETRCRISAQRDVSFQSFLRRNSPDVL